MISAPVTRQIEALFKARGLDPFLYENLISDLMKFTYTQMELAVTEQAEALLSAEIETVHEKYHDR